MAPRLESSPPAPLFTWLLWLQGFYFLATGLWPIFSIETFEMVTGPKTDDWLVRTVGVLVTATAVPMLVAAWRGRQPLEIALLAVGCAAGLGAIDVIFVLAKVISPIYLLDAAIEAILILAWCWAFVQKGRSAPV